RPPPDGGSHRPVHAAARDGAEPRDADLPGERAPAAAAVVAAAARRGGAAVVPRRSALRLARLFAVVPLDAGAAVARLPALHGRVGRVGEGSKAVRALRFSGRPLRAAL